MAAKHFSNNRINLVLDVGNTLTKIAVFENDKLLLCQKKSLLNIDILKSIIEKYSISKAIVSSVGEFPAYFEEFISQQIPLLVFNSKASLPITNCYKTPNTLGADRLAAAVAANYLFPERNILVVDSGSAITYDLISIKGEYLGGAISPGIEMRLKALNHFTAKLPLISFNTNFPLIGFDTETSILSGVLNGVLNEVEGYIEAIKPKYSSLEIVFTGGDAFFFDRKLKNSIFVHPNLVLFGLNRILEYNENP